MAVQTWEKMVMIYKETQKYVKERGYSGNAVIFSLPNRDCMRENSLFWSPSQVLTLCSISSAFLLEIVFHSHSTIIINIEDYCNTSFPPN